MKDKIEEIVSKKLAYCPEVKESDIYRVHRFRVEELKAELSTLIRESNREVLVGFIKWQWEMGMCGVMDNSVVEEYLSSTGKEER